MSVADQLQNKINARLAPVLSDYKKRLPLYQHPKIVRDVLWGFNRYEPYELVLIDSPPFQRLRNIFQTSLALFTYPCSVHSRFEHSLGVAAVASRMLKAIHERTKYSNRPMELTTRIACLVHDLGHGPFSHGSEAFYDSLTDPSTGQLLFGEDGLLARENRALFSEASASEILTYLMVTTPAFKDLWETIVDGYKKSEPDLEKVDLDLLGKMILGVDEGIKSVDRFYRQIVNGPFDADKLDYLPRDGYFTGLQINVDIERLLQTVTVIEQDGTTDLGVDSSGATILEQVIFAKTQLYSSVYHHHKVRSSLQLLLELFRSMRAGGCRPRDLDLNDPTAYMFLDDYDLLGTRHDVPQISLLIEKIKARNLPKRALVITYPCFAESDQESRDNFKKLEDADFNAIIQGVRDDLNLGAEMIVFDRPSLPRLFGIAQAPVQIAPNRPPLLLQDIYPSAAWGKAYAGYRRVTYVFTTAEDRRKVGASAKSALGRLPTPVRLNDNSLALAKL